MQVPTGRAAESRLSKDEMGVVGISRSRRHRFARVAENKTAASRFRRVENKPSSSNHGRARTVAFISRRSRTDRVGSPFRRLASQTISCRTTRRVPAYVAYRPAAVSVSHHWQHTAISDLADDLRRTLSRTKRYVFVIGRTDVNSRTPSLRHRRRCVCARSNGFLFTFLVNSYRRYSIPDFRRQREFVTRPYSCDIIYYSSRAFRRRIAII